MRVFVDGHTTGLVKAHVELALSLFLGCVII